MKQRGLEHGVREGNLAVCVGLVRKARRAGSFSRVSRACQAGLAGTFTIDEERTTRDAVSPVGFMNGSAPIAQTKI